MWLQRKSLEQELSQSSVLMLPLTILAIFIAYNYKKVRAVYFVRFELNTELELLKYLSIYRILHVMWFDIKEPFQFPRTYISHKYDELTNGMTDISQKYDELTNGTTGQDIILIVPVFLYQSLVL